MSEVSCGLYFYANNSDKLRKYFKDVEAQSFGLVAFVKDKLEDSTKYKIFIVLDAKRMRERGTRGAMDSLWYVCDKARVHGYQILGNVLWWTDSGHMLSYVDSDGSLCDYEINFMDDLLEDSSNDNIAVLEFVESLCSAVRGKSTEDIENICERLRATLLDDVKKEKENA